MQPYHTLTSCSVDVPLETTVRNSSTIREEPVPSDNGISIRSSATSSSISQADQGTISFTNVLQGHKTVVLVCCTIEWEPDTFTRKEEILLLLRVWSLALKLVTYLKIVWKTYKKLHLIYLQISQVWFDAQHIHVCYLLKRFLSIGC